MRDDELCSPAREDVVDINEMDDDKVDDGGEDFREVLCKLLVEDHRLS